MDGTCHCGAITCKVNGLPESETASNCTVCRRYGACGSTILQILVR
jgi:hypothetical protein